MSENRGASTNCQSNDIPPKIDTDEKSSQDLNQQGEKEEMNINHEPHETQTSQRATRISSSHSALSPITRIREVSLTSTDLHTLSNPDSTMATMTPAASGCDEAKKRIQINNCVSTVNLGCKLVLLDVYCKTRYSEYDPAKFHGVVMKIVEPQATALVFRSGKMVCTGAKNEHDSYIAARIFARIIQKIGFPVKFLDFKMKQFFASVDLQFPIQLESLQTVHSQFAAYEPELFPGLVYRMVRPTVVLLIFVNGKVVITGSRSRNDINEALDIMYPILRSFSTG